MYLLFSACVPDQLNKEAYLENSSVCIILRWWYTCWCLIPAAARDSGFSWTCKIATIWRQGFPIHYYLLLFLLPKTVLIGTALIAPQCIRRAGLDMALCARRHQHHPSLQRKENPGKKFKLTVFVICLLSPSSPSSCTACPFPIALKLSLIKNS